MVAIESVPAPMATGPVKVFSPREIERARAGLVQTQAEHSSAQ